MMMFAMILTRSQQEQCILNRVTQWQTAFAIEYEGNEVEEEVELLFEDKRQRIQSELV